MAQAKIRYVAGSHVQRGGRQINPDPAGHRHAGKARHQNTARPGAKIEYLDKGLRQGLGHQTFGFRPRVQHIAGHDKAVAPEQAMAGQMRHRLAGTAPRDQRIKTRHHGSVCHVLQVKRQPIRRDASRKRHQRPRVGGRIWHLGRAQFLHRARQCHRKGRHNPASASFWA